MYIYKTGNTCVFQVPSFCTNTFALEHTILKVLQLYDDDD